MPSNITVTTPALMKTDQSLKIGLVLDDTLDSPDGVQQYVLTLGTWLADQGHDVHYLVGETKRQDVPQLHSLARNFRVRYNGNRMSIPLPASRKGLKELLQQQQFDIIHVQVPYNPLLAGQLLKLLPATTAVVGTFHVLPYDRGVHWANRLLATVNQRTARRFDAMISSTEPTATFASSVYHFQSTVIPHPFVLANFKPVSTAATVPTVVFLGRLVERKGARQLLEAIASLHADHIVTEPFRVIIGGKGPLSSKLKAYVAVNDLSDCVTFAGFVAETDKASFLSQADIAVFPSLGGESFGISLLEGLAAARGVVLAGDNPGYRAVLAPLNPAMLIDPTNSADFSHILAQWLQDPTARQQAAQAQQTYVRQFDIAVVGQEVVEIYNQALRSRRNVR